MIVSLVSRQWIGLAVCGVLLLLFLHEAYGEQRFFSRYLQEMTEELRNLDASSEKK